MLQQSMQQHRKVDGCLETPFQRHQREQQNQKVKPQQKQKSTTSQYHKLSYQETQRNRVTKKIIIEQLEE